MWVGGGRVFYDILTFLGPFSREARKAVEKGIKGDFWRGKGVLRPKL
jgi:hypothetical protein